MPKDAELTKYLQKDTLCACKALLLERWDTSVTANSRKVGYNTCVLHIANYTERHPLDQVDRLFDGTDLSSGGTRGR